MRLVNPHTGKTVVATGEAAKRLVDAGFREEPVEPVKRKPQKKAD